MIWQAIRMVYAFFIYYLNIYLMRKLFLASFFALLSLCANAYTYDFEEGILYYKITGDNTVEVANNGGYVKYAGNITIPNSVVYESKEYKVTGIGHKAFAENYSLRSVNISNGVTSIGDSAFYSCVSLTSVTIPENVTSIGNHAFFDCYDLTSINIPESVTKIGDYAFYNCNGLTSINIPKNLTSIENYVFAQCFGLRSINIPSSVTYIESCLFLFCIFLSLIISTLQNYNAYYVCGRIATSPSAISIMG